MAEPSRLAHQLGRELRSARSFAGLTQRQIADRALVSQPRVSRAERGEVLLDRDETALWLSACTAEDDQVQRVMALTEAAHNETRAWSDLMPDEVAHAQDEAGERESTARLTRACQLVMIPGLLQTPDYAAAVLPLADPTGAMDVPAAVLARVDRQQVLFEPGRRFEFLLAEQALTWSPGPGVLAAALDRLAGLSTMPAVEVSVLPADRVGGLAPHGFIYREPFDDAGIDPYVTLELLHGSQRVSDPAAVEVYRRLWKRLSAVALHGDDARKAIRAALERATS